MAEGLTKKQIKELRKLEKLQSRNLEQKNNSVKWIAIAVVSALFLVLFVGIVLVAKNKNTPAANTGSTQFADTGHVRMITSKGEEATASADPSAQIVSIVEYADLQCPACKTYHPIVKELLAAYPDRVKLTFKHYPLVSIHPNAMPSALAAEAAGKQNKFFEYIDMLYEKQEVWSALPNPQAKFEEYAKALSLDLERFKKDQKDPSAEKSINDQREEGISNGVTGTPTFYLEGEKIESPVGIEEFKKLIDAKLKTATPQNSESTSPTSAPDPLQLQP
ncbi:MAG: thioredoxin domain-containing protein [Candidatus Levybacteria bacterium]|nr:thioredoxin domain-containing protein [Candidatus Levybacteria bacterium]